MTSLYKHACEYEKEKLLTLHIFLLSIFIIFILIAIFSVKCFAQESFLKTKVEKISATRQSSDERIKQVLRNLEIPEDIGFIKEVNVPSNPTGKMVINIQDLHCNYEAQKNIAAILEHLISTYGLKVISVEGGSGKIDTAFYKELPDAKIKEQVADYFLREARINGTEYYAITTERDISLYGAEDPKYYDKNLEAFLKALPSREKILENIAMLENGLNILKNRIYNDKLKDLDDHVVAYDNGELDFESYVKYVSSLYPEDNFKREFTQLPKLVESIEIKHTLDLDQAETQRKQLIEYLSKFLSRYDLEEFLRITVEFKAKTVDALTYHNTLKKLYDGMEKKSKTLDKEWPQLSLYIEYLNKHESLDKYGIFDELDKIAELIKNSLYTSYTQKRLDYNLRVIRLSRNLFSTKLLNRDMAVIRKYRADFNGMNMKKFIEGESRRLNLDLAIPADEELMLMEKTLPDVEDFYEYAGKRNDVLAANTVNSMDEEKEPIGILVTGGFHTEGIAEFFKEKRIIYAVVAPKVENIEEDDTRYINALQGKKTPFEEQLERENKLAKQN